MAKWKKFTGQGVCDVCRRPVEKCNEVFMVPNKKFYSSQKYKRHISNLAASTGATPDEYLAQIRAMDGSTHSAVCDECINLFESKWAASRRMDPQSKTLRRFPKGWIIAMIVIVSCGTLVSLQFLGGGNAGTGLLIVALLLCMLFGYILMLRKKALGFLLELVSSFILMYMDGAVANGYMLRVGIGFPLSILAFIATLWQIDYRFWLHIKRLLSTPRGERPPKAPKPAAALSQPRPIVTSVAQSALPVTSKAAPPPVLTQAPPPPAPPQAPPIMTQAAPSPVMTQAPPPPAPPQAPPVMPQAPPPVMTQAPPPPAPPHAPPVMPQAPPPVMTQAPPPPAPPHAPPVMPQAPPSDLYKASATQKPPKAPKVKPDASERPRQNINWYMIGGIAVFAVVVCVLIYTGALSSGGGALNSSNPATETQADNYVSEPLQTPPSAGKAAYEPSSEELLVLADIEQTFPELLKAAAAETSGNIILNAAVENVRFNDITFSDSGVSFMVQLPNPNPGNLSMLGIAPYVPFSGAQEYIKNTYPELRRINTLTSYIDFDVYLNYQSPTPNTDGGKDIDWSFPHAKFILMEYSDILEPNVDLFMTQLGFYTAAQEILLPDFQQWDAHSGDVTDQAFLQTYYRELAQALALKGIDSGGKLTVDPAQIERLLAARLGQCFAFGLLKIETERSQPQLKFSSFGHVAFFHEVYAILDAQYESGNLARPATMEALEQAYTEEARKQVNKSFGELTPAQAYSYNFEWEKLGNEGIAGCPELVEEVRRFMDAYDFSLMFLAHGALA